MESEIRQLRRKNETLKRENAELRQSLDESVRSTRAQAVQRRLGTADSSRSTDSELQLKLKRAIQQLAETRQQLLSVQERLAVAEQVTAVTQERQLKEGVYENLPSDSDYQQLRYDRSEEHIYAQLQTHKDALHAQYIYLVRTLDAHQVAVHMYQRNALTLRDLQSIQSFRDRPLKAAETLLNIIMEQAYAVYLCFLNVLNDSDTNHQHVYRTLVQDGYKDYDEQSSHTSVIREHYVSLRETLDVKLSGLLAHLYADQVISSMEKDDISAEQTPFRANEKLLSVLSRKSPQQFQLFLDALDNCGQSHIRNVITGPRERQMVHTLPEGPPVKGVVTLGEHVYVLRQSEGDQVEVYDATTYRLQCFLTVPNARSFTDMTACNHFMSLYISDPRGLCIHKLGMQGNATNWSVSDRPGGLSVNAAHNLLVTCRNVSKIKEFSTHGVLVREVSLPDGIVKPWHAIQLTSGQFVVCHGDGDDPLHRVCLVSADGRLTLQTHGGQRGSDTGQYKGPVHLAVDDNEHTVFVAEFGNRRVTLLSPTLNYLSHVVSRDQGRWEPVRLCLDVHRERRFLYVADNQFESGTGRYVAGRVVVASV